MSYGIDWGRNETNIDKETGIRFGVIQHDRVGAAWYENAEPVYPTDEELELDENDPEYYSIVDNLEPVCFSYNDKGYKCYQGADNPDIFVEKSPYFTFAEFCSPCAPGAMYLVNYIDAQGCYPGGMHDAHGVSIDNQRGYCLGHSWFEVGKAPYPVYSVETCERIEPEVTE